MDTMENAAPSPCESENITMEYDPMYDIPAMSPIPGMDSIPIYSSMCDYPEIASMPCPYDYSMESRPAMPGIYDEDMKCHMKRMYYTYMYRSAMNKAEAYRHKMMYYDHMDREYDC